MKSREIEELSKRSFFFNVTLSFVFNKIYKHCIYLLCSLYIYISNMFLERSRGTMMVGIYKVVVKRMGIEYCLSLAILF